MATYIEYQLEDGTSILVESDTVEAGGVTRASRDDAGNVIASSERSFEDAFIGVKKSAAILRRELDELGANQVELTFGLKVTGEVGVFAVCKAGLEANYTVKIQWNSENNQEKQKLEKTA